MAASSTRGPRCIALGITVSAGAAAVVRSAAAAFVGRPLVGGVSTAAARHASSSPSITERPVVFRMVAPGGVASGLWAVLPASTLAAGLGAAAGRRRRASSGRGSTLAMKAEGEQSDISQIDLRVGIIVSAKAHPESDKLLVEEIDLGEGEPRTICSGIAPWFTPDQIEGKKCVVVANLKERKLAGIPSNGMLLCAKEITEDEGGKLDIVEAPDGAEIGERIVIEVEGEEHGEPAAPNRVQKKKLYEKVAGDFNTNEDGTVCYKDMPFQTGAGVCTAKQIPKGAVS